MPAYVLTGTPGSGKTAILRQLEVDGYAVVEEAATDVIALQHALGRSEPWREPRFVDRVLELQRRRQLAAIAGPDRVVFFDRSPICTLALCRHLGVTVPGELVEQIDQMTADPWFRWPGPVFFVRNQGRVEPTAARRISLEDSLAFEHIHERVYRELGYELVDIPAAPLPERVAAVRHVVEHQGATPCDEQRPG